MHIPDGYLSPATAAVAFGAAAPFWYHASRKVKALLSSEAAPAVALFSAFCFTVQMFNFPLPGGTTAHAVGGTLVAVVLGPWAAVMAVSTALVIQALFFADGGVTALGANALNMAVALPLVGYAVYRLVAGSRPNPRRRMIASAVGGYAGINAAGLLTGIELGIQPLLWSDGGRALYSPYGLEVTVPTMLASHLTIAGIAEAALTALALAYLMRAHPELLARSAAGERRGAGRGVRSLVVGLGILSILTPVGLLAPGTADFEWGSEELHVLLGYVPAGLAEMERVWIQSPLPGYQMPGGGESLLVQAPAYVLSAVVGISLIFAAVFTLRILLTRRTRAVE